MDTTTGDHRQELSGLPASYPPIVAIGASAGGLEAIQIFFGNSRPGVGLAFVVVQHLSPDYKSLMPEILGRETSMKIVRVEDEVVVEANHIYLISPKTNLTIKGNRLIAEHHEGSHRFQFPIDHFFSALAKEHGPRATGVILSGTGSDGTRGCERIKAQGGLVIVQDPATAKFDGMPKSVIRHGSADCVLRAEDMFNAIVRFVNSPKTPLTAEEDDGSEEESNAFRPVINLLKKVNGIDFTEYRVGTIKRRIERRIPINQLSSLGEYIKLLAQDPAELKRLHNDLLIGVTEFFRNQDAFEVVRLKVVPSLLADPSVDPIRVWVVGCSTGQEVYSLAMLLHYAIETSNLMRDVQIFATDVDRAALEYASAGRYPLGILTEVPPYLLEKYFIKSDSYFDVRPQLRRSIIFSHHNLIRDPPFTKMNLISCRNLLIYFKPILQRRILSVFHFGLSPGGYMFLGKSEALGDLSSEFRAIDLNSKLFQKIRDIRLVSYPLSSQVPPIIGKPDEFSVGEQRGFIDRLKIPKTDAATQIQEQVLEAFVPACLVIDQNFQLHHIFGDASKFLSVPAGRTSFDVQKMLGSDLSAALTAGVIKASDGDTDVEIGSISGTSTEGRVYHMTIKRLPPLHERAHYLFAVVITLSDVVHPASLTPAKEVYDASTHAQRQILSLENQLVRTRQSLQATIEELETTVEELQSTNEELMSANEELQSSNEELQSVNEELHTVNAEHQTKIIELMQANQDIEYLLSNSNIGIIFLDQKMQIRRFSNNIHSLVNLVPHDVGRPITDIRFNFAQDIVMDQLKSLKATRHCDPAKTSHQGSTYLIKTILYGGALDTMADHDNPSGSGYIISYILVS